MFKVKIKNSQSKLEERIIAFNNKPFWYRALVFTGVKLIFIKARIRWMFKSQNQ